MASSEDEKVEMFFLPWIVARGHMIPMIDAARLFASYGVKVTILTTHDNLQLFQNGVDRDRSLGRDIDFLTFELPEGCENLLSIFTINWNEEQLFIEKLREPIEQILRDRRPDCLVSDMFYPWTAESGARLGIPRIVFHVTGLFPSCCEEATRRHTPQHKVDSDKATFALPGLPNPNHNIEFTRLKMPSFHTTEPKGAKLAEAIVDAELKSHGVIINSYYNLEAPYAEYFKNDMGRKLWLVGPVFLFNKNYEEKAQRGENNSIDGVTILNWLDTKEPKSVLYVSFGSQVRMAPEQFFVLAEALEASGHSFIWVARYMPESGEHEEEGSGRRVLPEGFEERMTKSGKGLIVRSWAPQLLILEHRSMGGFMTHCGWNSTVEGICACLPMITWPLAAEQFFIESLVVDVLKTGIRVGNEEWMALHWEPKVTVTREKVETAVKRLMGGGGEVEEMRRRARELSEKANKAVEPGGSSDADVVGLINELKSCRK
ncbi:unnamed protein product [Camellia sinensis]